jgi:tetratricopeptide (TPR) repeat protein
MSTANNLEYNGKLSEFPAVELLREGVASKLSGTFRFSQAQQKIAVYFDNGEIVFAASNSKQHRFLVKLLQWNFLQEKDLPLFQNVPDLEIGAKLVETGKLTPVSLEMCQLRLVAEIIAVPLLWLEGEWNYNPLVRVREDLRVTVDSAGLLVEASRLLPPDFVLSRFQNELDSVAPAEIAFQTFNMTPEEAYIYSRVDTAMSVDSLIAVSGLPEAQVKPIVYTVWLGGLLKRYNYTAAFDEAAIKRVLAASASANKAATAAKPVATAASASVPIKTEIKVAKVEAPAKPLEINKQPVITVSTEEEQKKAVEEFLSRVADAKTHYQVLDISNSAEASEVKLHYFRLAKQFHPDKFHHLAGSDTHSRLQTAFNRLSQAYETLKDVKSRELYDFKLKKEGIAAQADVSTLTPEQVFKQGMEKIQQGGYNEGVALLTRAVQLAPNVAEYHARFGQALSVNQKFRHQAESELQTAVRLDEKNADWRMALINFYLGVGLSKRAENELKKLLAIHPNHADARQKLNNLR